ncbi:MAG: gliding motility-associated C-terminal domain-containing protein [Muribaculaceae bacterium]|nr:gliding motility-associated C-terminal domain-containing protein [Muribaculaceae bacterium]
MRLISFLIPALCATAVSQGARISFEGGSLPVLEYDAEKASGLEKIFVAYNSSEITEMRIESDDSGMSLKRFSNLGGGFAEPVAFRWDGSVAVLDNPSGNMGYIVEENGRNYCIWLVDYHEYLLKVTSITAAREQDCFSTTLDLSGKGDAIHYFTIDGRQAELSRQLQLSYSNLSWNDEAEQYSQEACVKELAHLTSTVVITPPLYCNSDFLLTGDRFLKAWGRELKYTSDVIFANGLDVHTVATQTNSRDENSEEPSTLIKGDANALGGSAPADFEFRAFTSDAVVHNEWQIADDPEFEYITFRFNEQTVDYSFVEEGTYYVRFVGSNSDGSCEAFGETYTISIGASDLRIPNAFTPNGDGVNDVWKVGYRSLLSFRCTIFDRYGNEIFRFSDPEQGWDGKYKGKLVNPGVYFYVIEAKGADGKTYKKGGDINIIRSKKYSTGNAE